MSFKTVIAKVIKETDESNLKSKNISLIEPNLLNLSFYSNLINLEKENVPDIYNNQWYSGTDLNLKLSIIFNQLLESKNFTDVNIDLILKAIEINKKKNKSLPPEYFYAIKSACIELKTKKLKSFPDQDPFTNTEEILNETVKFLLINLYKQLNSILSEASNLQ